MNIIGCIVLFVLLVLFIYEIIALLIAILDKKAGQVPLHILGTITTGLLAFYMVIVVFKLEFSSELFVSIILALSIVFFFALSINTFFNEVKNKNNKRSPKRKSSSNLNIEGKINKE